MNELQNKTMEIIEEVDDIMSTVMKRYELKDFMCMEPEDIILMKKCLALMDASKELAILQARTLDEINSKLDRLLAK